MYTTYSVWNTGTTPFQQRVAAHERSKAAQSNAFIQLCVSKQARISDCGAVSCQCVLVIQAVFEILTFDSRFERSAVCCSSCSFTASCTFCSPANSSSRFFSCDLHIHSAFVCHWRSGLPHICTCCKEKWSQKPVCSNEHAYLKYYYYVGDACHTS